APQSQRRVPLLGAARDMVEELVGAEVEGADRDGARGQRLDDALVRLEVLLLVGSDRLVQVQELGPVEADPLGAALEAVVRFLRELDVAVKLDAEAVLGEGGLVLELIEGDGEGAVRLASDFVVLAGLLVGVEDDDAAIAVDDDLVASGNIRK